MKNSVLVQLYKILPKSLKTKLGKSSFLKPLRKLLLYNSNGFKTAQVLVERTYENYKVNFQFVASIKMASKAKNNGIENTVLRNSFQLIQKYKPNRTDLIVLDIGSNFGYLASVWADSIAQNGKVLAFEPNKNLHKSISKTIQANVNFKSNFEVHHLAVGAKNDAITLNASNFSSNAKAMDSVIETYTVDMVTLDGFLNTQNIKNIDVIKIDVDGIELDILKGAENLLKQNKSIVIVETNDNKRIIEFFQNIGYNIYDMKLNIFNNSEALPLNIFCVPKTIDNDAV